MLNFLSSLNLCISINPSHNLVLFMEGRMQLSLLMLSDQEKALVEKEAPNLPKVNPVEAESKLRQAINLDPTSLDGYITLAYVLLKAKKFPEAKQVVDKGLQVQQFTKSDEAIHNDLQKLSTLLQ